MEEANLKVLARVNPKNESLSTKKKIATHLFQNKTDSNPKSPRGYFSLSFMEISDLKKELHILTTVN